MPGRWGSQGWRLTAPPWHQRARRTSVHSTAKPLQYTLAIAAEEGILDSERFDPPPKMAGSVGSAEGIQSGSFDERRFGQVRDLLKQEWTLLVLQHLASGLRSPGDLLTAINERRDGLSRKVLHDTLNRLRDLELIDNHTQPGVPPVANYWLTAQGNALLTAASDLAEDPGPMPGVAVDTSRPYPARTWNHMLGGKDNFRVDRAAVAAVGQVSPGIVLTARLSRQLQTRTIQRLAAEEGVRQFLDIGTGLPTQNSVHEVAQRVAQDARVVYVDNDPMVLSHARALLTSSREGACDYVQADLRDPERILAEAGQTLDLRHQPVAIILNMVLHFIPDGEDPWGIVRRLADGLQSPAYLLIAHGATEHGTTAKAVGAYNDKSPVPIFLRSADEVARFFVEAGFTLLSPGLMSLASCFPEQADGLPPDVNGHVGLGRRSSRLPTATSASRS